MRSRLESILITLCLVLLVAAFVYLYWSRDTPYVTEIILGSFVFSVMLGVLSNLTQRYSDKLIGNKIGAALLVVLSCIAVIIVLLVILSNTPANIKKEISVMYLVDPNTKNLSSDFINESTTANVSYMKARILFKKFIELQSQDSEIEQGLGTLYADRYSSSVWEHFQNLTEYLIPRYIGSAFTTPEAGRTGYRRETGDWLGLPDKEIRGVPIAMDSIAGDFKNNIFYGMKEAIPWDTKQELLLPKKTCFNLERENEFRSKFIIKNIYLEIKIGVVLLPQESQGPAFMLDSFLLPDANSKWKDVKGFKRIQAMIYYDVTFNKWLYPFQEMRYYERWADSLFSFLQRSFAWGNPPVLNEREIRILSRRYDRHSKEE